MHRCCYYRKVLSLGFSQAEASPQHCCEAETRHLQEAAELVLLIRSCFLEQQWPLLCTCVLLTLSPCPRYWSLSCSFLPWWFWQKVHPDQVVTNLCSNKGTSLWESWGQTLRCSTGKTTTSHPYFWVLTKQQQIVTIQRHFKPGKLLALLPHWCHLASSIFFPLSLRDNIWRRLWKWHIGYAGAHTASAGSRDRQDDTPKRWTGMSCWQKGTNTTTAPCSPAPCQHTV